MKRVSGLVVGSRGDKFLREDMNRHGWVVFAPSCSTSSFPCSGWRCSVDRQGLIIVNLCVCFFLYRRDGGQGQVLK